MTEGGGPASWKSSFRELSVLLLSSGVVVALVSAAGGLLTGALSEDVERCRIATQFLVADRQADEMPPDRTVQTFYIAMARSYCVESGDG